MLATPMAVSSDVIIDVARVGQSAIMHTERIVGRVVCAQSSIVEQEQSVLAG
jgi:hypothetical protein